MKKVRRLDSEMGLQLRNKTPKRRVKAKLRDDRTDAIRPNDIWAMDVRLCHSDHWRDTGSPSLTVVSKWITNVGARTAFIEPGSPWENGFATTIGPVARGAAQCASFNGQLRNELLGGEIFYSLGEA